MKQNESNTEQKPAEAIHRGARLRSSFRRATSRTRKFVSDTAADTVLGTLEAGHRARTFAGKHPTAIAVGLVSVAMVALQIWWGSADTTDSEVVEPDVQQ